jgi:hypothetical protein
MDSKYSLLEDNVYTVDKWFSKVNNWYANDINGDKYKPATNYQLIEITIDDVNFLFLNKKFPEHVEKQLYELLDDSNSYFFRVSQRSPKDAYKNEYKAKDNDSCKTKLKLEVARKLKLLVTNINQVYDLIFRSERVIEDLELLVQQTEIKSLHLVFQQWRPSSGIEFRLFIVNSKLVGICVYKPEFYSSKITVPVGVILYWFEQFEKIYNNIPIYTVDIYVDKKTNQVFFIEINPFNDQVDTFSFEYKQLLKTKSLLVKIR